MAKNLEMIALMKVAASIWKKHGWQVVGIATIVTLAFYLLQLAALVIRFEQLPNYIKLYNWPENVALIIKSTPSLTDTLAIIKDEWFLEVGHMNSDFGLGISVWSLYLPPAKAVVVFLFSTLVVFNFFCFNQEKKFCSSPARLPQKFSSGLGASLFAMTSITMSWVVCCATPSWIVGLAILGLGVTASLKLEPVGGWVMLTGVALVVGSIIVQLKRLGNTYSDDLPVAGESVHRKPVSAR